MYLIAKVKTIIIATVLLSFGGGGGGGLLITNDVMEFQYNLSHSHSCFGSFLSRTFNGNLLLLIISDHIHRYSNCSCSVIATGNKLMLLN